MKHSESIIPTEAEIAEAEKLVESMKEAREKAKQSVLASIKSPEDILSILSGEDLIRLMQSLQRKLRSGHRKVRGSPVSPELKKNLEYALRQGDYSLSQLERIFNLSVSYISRVKHEMGLTKPKHRGQQAISVG